MAGAGLAELKVKLLDIRKGYRTSDWREDMKPLYVSTGVEKNHTAFMFLDSQIQVPRRKSNKSEQAGS